jgi:hypothetical protein
MARSPLAGGFQVAAYSYSYSSIYNDTAAAGSPPSSYPDARCYVCNDAAVFGSPTAPTLGGDIDGVVFQITGGGCMLIGAVPGNRCTVEAAAAFASGTILATLADGRVRTKGAGEIGVMIALEASAGAGSIVWAKFTSGR